MSTTTSHHGPIHDLHAYEASLGEPGDEASIAVMADLAERYRPGVVAEFDRRFNLRTRSQNSSSQSLEALRHVYQHKHDFPYASYLTILEARCKDSARTSNRKLKLTPSLLNNLVKHEWKADSVSSTEGRDIAARGDYVVIRELYHAILYFSKRLDHEQNLELAKSHDYFHGLFVSLWSDQLRHKHAASIVLSSANSIRPDMGWTRASAKWRDHLRHDFGAHENWLEWDWRFLKATYARKFHAHPPTEYLTKPEQSSDHNDLGNHSNVDPPHRLIALGPAVVGGFQALYIKMTLDHWSPPGRHDSGESKWLLAYLQDYHRHDLSYIRHLSVADDSMQEHIDAALHFVMSGYTTELPFNDRRGREVWHQLVGRIYETETPKTYRKTATVLRDLFCRSSKVWLEDDFRAWIHCLKVAQPDTTRLWTRAECQHFLELPEQLEGILNKSNPDPLISIPSLEEEGLFQGTWSDQPNFYYSELMYRLPDYHSRHDKRNRLRFPPSNADSRAYGSKHLGELDELHRHLLSEGNSRAMKPNDWEHDDDATRKRVSSQWYRYHEWLLRPTQQLPDKIGLAQHYLAFRTLYTKLGEDGYTGLPGERPPFGSWKDAIATRRSLLKRDFNLDWLLGDFAYYEKHKSKPDAKAYAKEHDHFEELYASLKAGKRPVVFCYSDQEYETKKGTLLGLFKDEWDKRKSKGERVLRHKDPIGQHHEHYDSDDHESHGTSADRHSHYPTRSITGPAFFRSVLHQFDTYRLVGDTDFKHFAITPRGAQQDPGQADGGPPFAGRSKPPTESMSDVKLELYRCLECLAGNRYSPEQTKEVLRQYKHFRKVGEYLSCHTPQFAGFTPPGGWRAAAIHVSVELRREYGRTDDWLNLDYSLALAMRSATSGLRATPRGWNPNNFELMRARGPITCGYFHTLHVALGHEKWKPSFGQADAKYLADLDEWLVEKYEGLWQIEHAAHTHSVHGSSTVGR